MNAKRAVAFGLVFALMSAGGIIWAVPSVDDFSLENPYWNGMSSAAAGLGISDLASAGSPDPAGTVLLLVGPDLPFSPERVSGIASFLESGGVVLLMDDFGEGNSLLEGLGAQVRVNGSLLLDPLFMEKSRQYPRVSPPEGSPLPAGMEVTMDYASVLEIAPGTGQYRVRALLESSAFSFLDLNGDGEHTAGEPYGPFPVAAEVSYGKGRLVVVSDSSILINSVYGIQAGNAGFVMAVAGNRSIAVDYGNNAASPYATLRSGLLSAVGAVGEYPELRYFLAVVGVGLLFAMDPRSAANWALGRGRKGGGGGVGGGDGDGVVEEGLERVAEAHPDWDRGLLRDTWEEMRLARTSAHADAYDGAGSIRGMGSVLDPFSAPKDGQQ